MVYVKVKLMNFNEILVIDIIFLCDGIDLFLVVKKLYVVSIGLGFIYVSGYGILEECILVVWS